MVNNDTEILVLVGTQLEERSNQLVWTYQTKRINGRTANKNHQLKYHMGEEIQYMSLIQQSWSVGMEFQQT